MTRLRTSTDPLEARAQNWHEQFIGRGCDCHTIGDYPCPECREEIAALLDLLDEVAQEAIRLTSEAWERLDHAQR